MNFSLKARELYEAQKRRKQYELLEDKLKEELKELCGHESHSENGFNFAYIVRKGQVQYNKIPALKNMNLEPFRGPDIKQWKLVIELNSDSPA